MQTWHIHIKGQVQGVGFRPFVYQLAYKFKVKGWVNNDLDGVHVCFNAASDLAQEFYHTILQEPPILAQITASSLDEIPVAFFEDFRIVESQSEGEVSLLLCPDFAICECCRKEMVQATNRREAYSFTTCTNCGPRYSIIKGLPYDREHTSMAEYTMCNQCAEEYHNPLDRRYYSQTNSCPTCPVQLQWYEMKSGSFQPTAGTEKVILEKAVAAIRAGAVLAIKGIGGYLLCCDAKQPASVATLRKRKHRPLKPFALMYPSLDRLQQDTDFNAVEASALTSSISPIVLLPLKEKEATALAWNEIAPGLSHIGAMLAYTPLFAHLLAALGHPIVATSGNIAGSNIVFEDDKALAVFNGIADAILANDREIVIAQDDSVVRFSDSIQQRIILRRSRGMAPTFVQNGLPLEGRNYLATGAEVKGTFAFTHANNVYLSQYLGDLASWESQQHYQQLIKHFQGLIRFNPSLVLCDLHPAYFATKYAKELAREYGVPIQPIQHHEAHFAAILGEHLLLETAHPVLGVIWDGMGLGTDGNLWGGEFFLFKNQQMTRLFHFDYFDQILQDKMAKEPRIAALSATSGIEGAQACLRPAFNVTEWRLYQKMVAKKSNLQTSSIGRLFDAVAALLGVSYVISFEGEAAMKLEALAANYMRQQGWTFDDTYDDGLQLSPIINTRYLLNQIVRDLQKGVAKGHIAAKFHATLVQVIVRVADQVGVRKIAFSGGVFQNKCLVDMAIHKLGNDFELFFHQDLSANDENIAFGQMMKHLIDSNKP